MSFTNRLDVLLFNILLTTDRVMKYMQIEPHVSLFPPHLSIQGTGNVLILLLLIQLHVARDSFLQKVKLNISIHQNKIRFWEVKDNQNLSKSEKETLLVEMPTAQETLQRFKEFVYPNHPVLTASVDTLLEKDLIRILERKL